MSPVALARTGTETAWEWRATGTRWRIHHGGAVGSGCASAAMELVTRDEERWSRFDADSEVTRLSARAGRYVHVSAETYALLCACIRWQARSRGLFQPLVGGALCAWGYERSLAERPAGATRLPVRRPVIGTIELDRVARAARIPAGTALDLGGIAKGWIAARLGRWLAQSCGGASLLVDAGGDILAVRGEHLVSVDHGTGAIAGVLMLPGGAIATSGSDARSWVNADGSTAHHLIDPSTGAPAARSVATVVARDVVTADVLATVLALDPARIARMRRPAAVTRHGELRATAAWAAVARSRLAT
ncbi:MAG: FAD:protein transferase [Gaiellales bacterium]|nr:FAD:protein transferase [Gaiellales bacterium]